MTKPADTPESANKSNPKRYRVKRRLKEGTYSKENEKYVWFWLDWHYFPLAPECYAPLFSSKSAAKKYIKEQKNEWPNFDYKIINADE